MTNYSTRVYDDGSHRNYSDKNKVAGRQTRADFYNLTHFSKENLPAVVTRPIRSFKRLENRVGGKK